MSGRWVIATLVALVTATASACGESEEEGVDQIVVGGSVRDPAGARITARVEQPGRTTVFTSEQITGVPGNGGVSTARVRTGRAGLMLVTVVVTTTPSDTIATGDVTFDLNRGHLYSVNVVRQPAGRGYTCLGCSGYRAFPFRGSEAATTDSLWLYYVAREPCRGCVY